MNHWEWECFEGYINRHSFHITNSGPLISPIQSFRVKRNKKRVIILQTQAVDAPARNREPAYPAGTVRQNTDIIEFASKSGKRCIARGVSTLGHSGHYNSSGAHEIREKAELYSLEANFEENDAPAFTFDWIENLSDGGYIWTGSVVNDENKIAKERVIGDRLTGIVLKSSFLIDGGIRRALHLNVGGIQLYLCVAPDNKKNKRHPGYIAYAGNPSEDIRKKIRNVLSFCLGNYLVYLGSTVLSKELSVISIIAISAAPPMGNRVFDIPVVPPCPLGKLYENEVNENLLSFMANAIYVKYDALKFNEIIWAYWHAVCAPVHIAAAHFGAAIEALQRTYAKSNFPGEQKKLVPDRAVWKELKSDLLQVAKGKNLADDVAAILRSKIENLNQLPQPIISEKMLQSIGLQLGDLERKAWRRRNLAAHGGAVSERDIIETIRDTKLLAIILHRIIHRVTGASEDYYDNYTIGHAVRRVTEPIPAA